MPKQVWRLPSTRRTLDPISIDPLVARAWQQALKEPALPVTIVADIEGDPPAIKSTAIRKTKPRDRSGALEVHVSGQVVKLKLNGEACRQQVYTPRRNTQHLGTLQLWEPVRVKLNGKADWSSGRFYYLQDYYVVICGQSLPGKLPTPRLMNLEADLF